MKIMPLNLIKINFLSKIVVIRHSPYFSIYMQDLQSKN